MKTRTAQEGGRLLDCFLKNFPSINRTRAKQLLKFGAIQVNGRPVTQFDSAVKRGDTLHVEPRPGPGRSEVGPRAPFPIVYEDEWLLAIDKPAGLLTVSTEKVKTKTAYFQLTDYARRTGPTGRGRVFIVHRIDRDTSGLLVFARDENTRRDLQDHWDQVEKKYYAIVEGVPKVSQDTIESFLAEDKFRRVYSTRRSKFSKKAATHYRVIKSSGPFSLLDVQLLTGRKNQIRVHLSDLGHPVIGDEKYGSHSDPAGRMGLHAYSLSFTHPHTKERVVLRSPLPPALRRIFKVHPS